MKNEQRVLLVDNDPDFGDLISLILGQEEGYTVRVCRSSGDALASAQSFRPDLILLDVMMPGMDGPETLRALRANETTASIPVIFMSAGVNWHDAPRFQKLGALGVIPKPFEGTLLPAMLRRICSGQPIKQSFPTDFDALREAYLRELPEAVSAMAALAAALVASGWQKPTVESLMQMAHRLSGSSGLYRVDGVARAAGVLGAMLRRLLEAPRWPPSRPPSEVATLIKALASASPGRARSARHRQTHVHA
jgi:two-component system OmpR family response regulator